MKITLHFFKKNISSIAAYLSTAYFIEIIYIMFLISMLSGKSAAVLTGIILSILLAWLSISLYLKKRPARIIQLLIMDLHAALAVVSLKSFIGMSITPGAADTFIVIFRTVFFFVEIALIYFLTGDETIRLFNNQHPGQQLENRV